MNQEEHVKKEHIHRIMELKKKLAESGIDTTNLVYMPQVPMLGIEKIYAIEEYFGIKVAILISPTDD